MTERVYEVPIYFTLAGALMVRAKSKREALAIAREDPPDEDSRVVLRINDCGGLPTIGAGPLKEVTRYGRSPEQTVSGDESVLDRAESEVHTTLTSRTDGSK